MSKELGGILKAWEVTIRKSQAAAKRRASSIFATMSVAHVDDDEENPTNEVYHAEEVFANGDIYIGQWAENCPHGHGKYLWADGCMYVGDWSKGKTMGRGKFSWPSGATYEGQFKNGYMDCEGTYTGSSNDTYKGSWMMNMKHGRGTKSYANGDHYEGEWHHGVQDGQGRYQWKNGNQYIGSWKNGNMNGNGTIIWANGNRYDGCWVDGLPKGNGTFRWPDGSFYVGAWSKEPKEQTGIFYPSTSQMGNFDWDPKKVYTEDLKDCIISPGEKISILPSQKVFNWLSVEGEFIQKQRIWKSSEVDDRKPRRMSRQSNGGAYSWDSEGDAGLQNSQRRDGDEGLGNLQLDDSDTLRGTPRQRIRIQTVRRQGETICKGHRNYELMLNLQLGIRPSAFDTKEKVWTKFPPEGSKHTPPHQSCDFKWKDYNPLVFRTLRKLFKVDPADYMISICGNDALRELSSPGKSGSFFYLTNDDKYMIKTMKKSEVKVLLRMLPAYFSHVQAFENTLITKFFGLHCVKLTGAAQKKVRFVIMGNLFCSEYPIHRRFDLKGSSHGRTTDKPETEIDATTTLKDLDLNLIFRLQKVWFQEFCRQVDRDCDFLEQERIMDYSLLIGLHFRETYSKEQLTTESHTSGVCIPTGLLFTLLLLLVLFMEYLLKRENFLSKTLAGNPDPDSEEATPRLSKSDMDLLFNPTGWASVSLGMNMSAKAEQTVRSYETQLVGEPTGEYYDVMLFFGIIDILQDYDISKKLEHAYKSIQYDPISISAVDPRQYSKRFRDFIFRIFTEDT
ncbi:hypothetical protein RJ639_027443 [Escallonia herrerae]|uniref:Phosphatidylinositol 4-phosphate 5-kinase n=1 Tax=Escallonia herrerae TaxID=1293975 RepID=A0AA88X300_9ASTE|nr:hypothetical protein RJ639_027443 [Escallonia herrerae]